MVTIKKGEHITTVSMGAFTSIFQKMGYAIMGEETPPVAPIVEAPEIVEADITEKPLSEMSVTELREYAGIMGIDVAGIKGRENLREAIKKGNSHD